MDAFLQLEADPDEASLPAREQAYRLLRRRLITLDLPPGTAVDVARLMRETSLGKTPLTEAIQRLALEDLLTIHPRRGTVVTQPTFSQARYIIEVRDIFEGRAARLAAQRASARDLVELRGLFEQQLAERNEEDYAQFLLHDHRLHMRVAAISGNPLLVRALDHLLALNMRLWFVFFQLQGPQARYLLSHDPILRAIEARDPDGAEAAAVAHVRQSNETLVTMFQTRHEPTRELAVGGIADASRGRTESPARPRDATKGMAVKS
jgi:DNA-binding GntR family transcriptional regulator